MKSWPLPMMCLLLVSARAEASIIDGVSVEYGIDASSECELTMSRIGLQKSWEKQWYKGDVWHVGGYWELGLAYWENESRHRTNRGITDIGFTPTFRLEKNHPSAFNPYIEGAVGVHVLSHASVSSGRRFGSTFAFGDHIGFGACFGPKNAFDLSYRFQHLSNAGIKAPNEGINFSQIRFGMHF